MSLGARPMDFKDSTMALGDFGPNWREAWVNHALTPRDAFGAGGIWMRSDDKRITREFAELNYTRLVKRWNTPWFMVLNYSALAATSFVLWWRGR